MRQVSDIVYIFPATFHGTPALDRKVFTLCATLIPFAMALAGILFPARMEKMLGNRASRALMHVSGFLAFFFSLAAWITWTGDTLVPKRWWTVFCIVMIVLSAGLNVFLWVRTKIPSWLLFTLVVCLPSAPFIYRLVTNDDFFLGKKSIILVAISVFGVVALLFRSYRRKRWYEISALGLMLFIFGWLVWASVHFATDWGFVL